MMGNYIPKQKHSFRYKAYAPEGSMACGLRCRLVLTVDIRICKWHSFKPRSRLCGSTLGLSHWFTSSHIHVGQCSPFCHFSTYAEDTCFRTLFIFSHIGLVDSNSKRSNTAPFQQ